MQLVLFAVPMFQSQNMGRTCATPILGRSITKQGGWAVKFSTELEEALRDGGPEAITLALHQAIKCNDLPFIAWLTKLLNEQRGAPSAGEKP